jgi:hypothetical protein
MTMFENIVNLLMKSFIDIFLKSLDPSYLVTGKKENEIMNDINHVLFE